jgi:hypothetical protein
MMQACEVGDVFGVPGRAATEANGDGACLPRKQAGASHEYAFSIENSFAVAQSHHILLRARRMLPLP